MTKIALRQADDYDTFGDMLKHFEQYNVKDIALSTTHHPKKGTLYTAIVTYEE